MSVRPLFKITNSNLDIDILGEWANPTNLPIIGFMVRTYMGVFRISTDHSRFSVFMFGCRNQEEQHKLKNDKTRNREHIDFNVETRIGKKPHGVHELQKQITMMMEYNKMLEGNDLEIFLVNRQLWSYTLFHSLICSHCYTSNHLS